MSQNQMLLCIRSVSLDCSIGSVSFVFWLHANLEIIDDGKGKWRITYILSSHEHMAHMHLVCFDRVDFKETVMAEDMAWL